MFDLKMNIKKQKKNAVSGPNLDLGGYHYKSFDHNRLRSNQSSRHY